MTKLINFPYNKILVLGLAKSGTAAAKVLLSNNKIVRVNDMNTKMTDPIISELKDMGADIFLGSHPIEVLDEIEIIVKNPGISYEHPIIVEAEKRDIPVITEIELAYTLSKGPIIGITGSNGKTTTTTLIYEFFKESNVSTRLAGNIGIVATETANMMEQGESLVLELSSFQLQGILKFRPKIAVLLNIFEAHLDYHKSFKNYTLAKCNIFKNQSETDYLVYNADDSTIVQYICDAKSKLIPFSIHKNVENGAYIEDNYIYFKDEKVIHTDEIVLVGSHNLENILAAVACAKLHGATNEGIRQVLLTFSGVEHRLQFVDKVKGRLFYNDSKATNILATQKALTSFDKPVILLAGGLDRGNEFTDLLPYLDRVKAMVLFGETKEKLRSVAEQKGIEIIQLVDRMEEAVNSAFSISEEGDVILLSPACASWDQYRTFEERGDMFIQAVHKLM